MQHKTLFNLSSPTHLPKFFPTANRDLNIGQILNQPSPPFGGEGAIHGWGQATAKAIFGPDPNHFFLSLNFERISHRGKKAR